MRARHLVIAMLVPLSLLGCGGDGGATARDLRSDRLTVVDWAAAAPQALCQTRDAARATPGRRAVRTADGPDGRACWVALRPVAPLARGADVTAVARTDDGREELRFTPRARGRLVALGPDAHVGVLYGERLLDVVFPQDGRVRVPAAGD